MTTPPGLTDADRAYLHERLVSWFGDDRQAFLVSHLAPVVDRIKADGYIAGLAVGVEVRASEFQQTALEMARKADQAERRADDVEAVIEATRDLLDGWEHDGPDDYAVRLLIQRVRETLAPGERFRTSREGER